MATFYIEAIEATQIALVKVGSPTIGTVKYGVNDPTCPNSYTVTTSSTPISLTAGQKCYWTITSTPLNFATSKYLRFTSTGKINVGGALSDLIGGNSSIPRNYCFYRLFYNCDKLVDASNLVMVNDFNSKAYCYNSMFEGCTSLTSAPELPATKLAEGCYAYMFQGCTSLKLSKSQTGDYQIPYRIPSSGTGTAAPAALNNMFANTGGTFTGTPSINTTYYLYGTLPTTPTTITYKGQQLTEFDSGIKTLKCDGKYMEDDIVVYREKGTATISYNGATIATVTDGTKTLKCAGKLMAGDVIIENE